MRSQTLAVGGRSGRLGLAITRLSSFFDTRARSTPTPAQDAYSIVLGLNPLQRHERWQAGRRIFGDSYPAGTVSIVDLREPVEVVVHGPVQAMQFYVPHQALDDYAREIGAGAVAPLRFDRSRPDPILTSIAHMLMQAGGEGEAQGLLFQDQLLLSLLSHFATTYGAMRRIGEPFGGLAGWQERRALEVMHARLAVPITIADIARECRLTPSHFARAFRRTMGEAPHQFLTRLRLERARDLMRTTMLPLADIALLCGFSDQSYFTRVFTRRVGTSPGHWRRLNRF